jgi:hypothetical protein
MAPAKKQLVVLLIVAAWISLAGLISYSGQSFYLGMMSEAAVQMVLKCFVYSLPAILFGVALFWWFGRQKT